ncbi:MAG: AMP-binding protein [Solirubrobacterales bacterium]|nr:AMP-binding protein [Solirubrobacterales bacterium]
MNLATLADQSAERYGDRVLAVFDDATVTYAQLPDRAGHVAAGLRDLGVTAGDRVAIMMGNRSEFLYAWFGILRLGAIEVPIHDAARGPGISHILNTTEARVVIVEDVFLGHVLPWLGDSPSVEHVVVVGTPPGEANGGRALQDFADLLANPGTVQTADVEPSQPASILFTGGTTGPPKGVVLPHNHNINLAVSTAEIAGYTEDDVLLSVFPLFHANAKYMTVMAAMVAGAKSIVNRRFSASRFWEQCRRERVTAFNGMGEMLRILMKQPEAPADADNPVRVVIGAAAPRDQVLEFESRYGLAILDVYGLTETGPITFNTYEQRRAGSMGVPVAWYEVRVLDENDEEVPVGEAGEICIRPARPNVMMAGYWGNDSATMKSIRNLWFHTGDHGYRDADGFFFFKARETDSIRRRGENVSAWEVERVLALHEEVLESAVYGVSSPLGGQDVMAAIVVRAGATLTPEALLDFCTERMAHFAVPRYLRFVDALPKSHAQRILKQELKAEGAEADGVWDRESVGYQVRR